MVPLFKSVSYQLMCHTFSEKCEYIKFKLRLRPSTFPFWRQLESQKNITQDMQISRLQTCFSAINSNNILLK